MNQIDKGFESPPAEDDDCNVSIGDRDDEEELDRQLLDSQEEGDPVSPQ